MPMLTVKCGRCNAVVPTGSVMDYETFRAATFQTRTAECPNCETVITWNLDDVDRSVFRENKS